MTAHLERDVADVARKWVPDTRLGVFEVTVQPGALAGCTTSRDALAALRRIAADARLAADIRLLPDSSVGDEQAAVVTAAVAPLLHEPGVSADRVSEALHGEILELLERRSGGAGVRPVGGAGAPGGAWPAPAWSGRPTRPAAWRCRGIPTCSPPPAGTCRSRPPAAATPQATCCASPTGAASRTWRCGPARGTSCTRPCRAAASSRMTCSPTRRRCGGCGSTSSRCGGGEGAPEGVGRRAGRGRREDVGGG